ncbi:MAG: flagellar type III secretion system pore protein FliP [Fimbriimonas ginsengisoli]|uniref:Flagellar biosynthetic protein FliP n=1 Tax=Fimbriimonas ginsengisoli TaxID=1005039 RepID=A0A931LT45_FIMGI|nr:flagellar type III secretion system pore protein FliP [Fimbriimonas ginsengisoli]
MSPQARRFWLRLIPVILLAGLGVLALAQSLPTPSVSINLGQAPPGAGQKGPQEVASSLQILALLTVLSLAPALLILTTAFTRIVIIFSFLRNALGTPSIPPNQVLIGLSLFLTFFVMAPTYGRINDEAVKPYMQKQIDLDQAIERGSKPLRAFMLKNTYEQDLVLFVNLRKEQPKTMDDVSLVTLVPAFVISELKTAFVVGFYIFLPFLIIDLVVASGLMSMGMMMLPPTVVSLPAKLLVFVLANGWATLVSAIITGYR